MGSTLPLVATSRRMFWKLAWATPAGMRSRVRRRIPETTRARRRRPAPHTKTGLVRLASNVGIVTNSQYMTQPRVAAKQLLFVEFERVPEETCRPRRERLLEAAGDDHGLQRDPIAEVVSGEF